MTITARYHLSDEFRVQEVVDNVVRPLLAAACDCLDIGIELNHVRIPSTRESGLELTITRKPTPMKVSRIDKQA